MPALCKYLVMAHGLGGQQLWRIEIREIAMNKTAEESYTHHRNVSMKATGIPVCTWADLSDDMRRAWEVQRFEYALDDYLEGVQGMVDAQARGVRCLGQGYVGNRQREAQVETSRGRRYVRVYTNHKERGKSAHSFIDRANGDVLMAASWKAPAKHARGNIYNEDSGLSGVSWAGANYLNGK